MGEGWKFVNFCDFVAKFFSKVGGFFITNSGTVLNIVLI